VSDRPYKVPRVLKAAVYREIELLTLQPSDFAWQPYGTGSGGGVEIIHQPTGSSFSVTFGYLGEGWYARWDPADSKGDRAARCINEDEVFARIQLWLKRVKREHETPDLWAALAQERELISGVAVDGDEGFTAAEQRLVHERLN
jgi:hypothetical protein